MTMTSKKNPPMAKAIRAFVTDMQFPPAPKHGPNPNSDFAALIVAMLLHCNGLKEDAGEVTCSPSLQQLAELRHCSPNTIKRQMRRLRDFGTVTSQRRGDGLSSVYTLHKTPVQTDQQLSHQQPDQQLSHLKLSDGSTRDFRRINSPIQTDQLDRSDGSTVDPLRDTPQDKTPQDKTTFQESPMKLPEGLIFRDGKVVKVGAR
jgi:DNA-binding transcriptional regulator YhcF (GntR family)